MPFRWRARRPSGAAQWGPPKPAIKQVWVCRIQGRWGSFENARQRSMRVPSAPHAIAKQAAAENVEATRENSRQAPHARPSWQHSSNGMPRNTVRPATGPRLPVKGPKSGLTLKLDRPHPSCVGRGANMYVACLSPLTLCPQVDVHKSTTLDYYDAASRRLARRIGRMHR